MVRCQTCGHLKSLHSKEGNSCRATARDRTSPYKCNYECTCTRFVAEPPKRKPIKIYVHRGCVVSVKDIPSGYDYLIIDKDVLEREDKCPENMKSQSN